MCRKYQILFIVCMSLMLAGCGNTHGALTKPTEASPLPNQLQDEVTPKEGPELESEKEDLPDQQTEPTTAPSTETNPSEAKPAAAEAAERPYYMNSKYIFVPKKEQTEPKVVLLTFDDGPKKAELLTTLLDTLDKHNAKAIFFVNGYRIKENPDLLKFIHEHGQTIGNHSWDHINLKKLSNEEIDKQIEDVQEIVRELTGETPKFFRPPFGAGNDYVKEKAANEGMLYMTWSNGSQDWVKGYEHPDKVIDSVMDQLHPGSNILMHELPWTAEGLDTMLTQLEAKGYSFLDPAQIDRDYSKN